MKQLKQEGMTLPELLVAITVAVILSSVVVAINLNFFGSVSQSRITAELAVESHFALSTMIEDIRLADAIATTNTIADANQSGGWTTSDAGNVLVLDSPAVDGSNNIIYNPETGDPYRNQQIYFIADTTLYKRTLMNPDAPGNAAKTTCPAALATSTCPADKQYTEYISDLTLIFYDVDNAATTDPVLARSVKAGLNMSRQSFGQSIAFNNSIQTTLRN